VISEGADSDSRAGPFGCVVVPQRHRPDGEDQPSAGDGKVDDGQGKSDCDQIPSDVAGNAAGGGQGVACERADGQQRDFAHHEPHAGVAREVVGIVDIDGGRQKPGPGWARWLLARRSLTPNTKGEMLEY
jgi:hypothetical protein